MFVEFVWKVDGYCGWRFNIKIMKERIVYLIKIFMVFAVFFALTKPFFLWLNEPEGTHYTLGQILQTVGHGVPMDAAMCGYILILPFVGVS